MPITVPNGARLRGQISNWRYKSADLCSCKFWLANKINRNHKQNGKTRFFNCIRKWFVFKLQTKLVILADTISSAGFQLNPRLD